MADVTIRKIPAHIVYRAEYDVNSLMDFFNPETDENELYDLQLEMEADNPGVTVPEIGEDYNSDETPTEPCMSSTATWWTKWVVTVLQAHTVSLKYRRSRRPVTCIRDPLIPLRRGSQS